MNKSVARCTFLCLLVSVSSLHGQDAEAPALSLRRVVLFNSSVGYFEHSGSIEGDQPLAFEFPVRDMNDILKSLVVVDRGGKQKTTVTYETREPVERTLSSFTVDLAGERSTADLLRQLRGQSIRLQSKPPCEGLLLGVERRPVVIGDHVAEMDVVNVKTTGGLRSVPMHRIDEIEFLEDATNREFQRALELLAQSQRDETRTMTVRCDGEGARDVVVGYLREFPLWRTSYRLVLEDGDQESLLQGWAHLENVTDNDWKEVHMVLVSGQPVTFLMDLYEPIYLQRPLVQPEYLKGLPSIRYGADLQALAGDQRPLVTSVIPEMSGGMAGMPGMPGGGGGYGGGGMGGGGGGFGGLPGDYAVRTDEMQRLATSASGREVGELFRYDVDVPVSLARHQSCMLPIVNHKVPTQRISIYDPQVNSEHPLLGLRFTNATDLHLMAGPITVFDGGEFAGDAQIADIPPKASRLLSYALDVDCDLDVEEKEAPQQVVQMQLMRGVIFITRKQIRSRRYLAHNGDDRPRTILIEQPINTGWKLVTPEKPAQRTSEGYRFELPVEAGKQAQLVVREEHFEKDEIAVTSLELEQIAQYTKQPDASAPVKEALQTIIAHKRQLKALFDKRGQIRSQLDAIATEQGRIRQNMEQLDRTSELYKRYVDTLTKQEATIEQLRPQLNEVLQQESAQQQTLSDFISNLQVE